MLQSGGNAVDAGVATILAASVIEFSHFSFGGEVPILIKLKGSDVVVVEGMGQAPMKATRDFFANRQTSGQNDGGATAPDSSRAQRGATDMASIAGAKSGPIPSTGPLSATVPAVLGACITALDQFGTKSLGEVMQPAIELADGFQLMNFVSNILRPGLLSSLSGPRRNACSSQTVKYLKLGQSLYRRTWRKQCETLSERNVWRQKERRTIGMRDSSLLAITFTAAQ
jgi:gamma-glutamyltranspeptidase